MILAQVFFITFGNIKTNKNELKSANLLVAT